MVVVSMFDYLGGKNDFTCTANVGKVDHAQFMKEVFGTGLPLQHGHWPAAAPHNFKLPSCHLSVG